MKRIFLSPRLWIGIAFIAFLILLRLSGITDCFTFASLQYQRDQMQIVVQHHYWLSALFYIGMYTGIVMSALPLVALTSILGGFLFGIIPAVIYINIGAVVGSAIFFLIVRHSLGSLVQERYRDRLQAFNHAMDRYGTAYLVAIHFVAVIPFALLNALVGMTRVSLWTFIWTTSVGIIPGSILYAVAGKQLARITSLRDIISIELVIAFCLLALLALAPMIIQRIRGMRS